MFERDGIWFHDVRIPSFPASSQLVVGDVIGIGVDNVRDIYVTYNGHRVPMPYMNFKCPFLSAKCEYALYDCKDHADDCVSVWTGEPKFDAEQYANRTPANCPFMPPEDGSCPLSRLPQALLSTILCEWVLLEGVVGMTILMRVCKSWLSAVRRHNALWAYIYKVSYNSFFSSPCK